MSQENVENLRAWLNAWNPEAWRRGEFDTSLLDPHVVYEDESLPDHVGEAYTGHEGVARATRRWIEPFEWLSVELERIIDADDCLVSIHRARAKARESAIEFEETYAYVWAFRGGMVIHFQSFREPEDALKAAGLSA
jgi:ketosteroid isomerase-like protein